MHPRSTVLRPRASRVTRNRLQHAEQVCLFSPRLLLDRALQNAAVGLLQGAGGDSGVGRGGWVRVYLSGMLYDELLADAVEDS